MKYGKNREIKDEKRRYIRDTAITGENKNILTKDRKSGEKGEKEGKITERK